VLYAHLYYILFVQFVHHVHIKKNAFSMQGDLVDKKRNKPKEGECIQILKYRRTVYETVKYIIS